MICQFVMMPLATWYSAIHKPDAVSYDFEALAFLLAACTVGVLSPPALFIIWLVYLTE